KARATGDPGPAELVATAICALRTGSTSSHTRMSPAIGFAHSQVCGTMQAQSPVATCANNEATESVSTCGLMMMVLSAKAASITCLTAVSGVSNASGSCAASGHCSVEVPAGSMSAGASNT